MVCNYWYPKKVQEQVWNFQIENLISRLQIVIYSIPVRYLASGATYKIV